MMYGVPVQGLGDVIRGLCGCVTAQSCRLSGGRVLRVAHHRAGLTARRFAAAAAVVVRHGQHLLLRHELLFGSR